MIKAIGKKTMSVIILASLSSTSFSATAPVVKAQPNYWVPVIEEKSQSADKSEVAAKWNQSKRKVASSQSFSESDLSADFKKLRAEWLQVTTPDQLEALLKVADSKYDSYSDDTKYFLAQMDIALSLRGIVWRLRPLLETGGKFIGNKSTHVSAVQFIRGMATGMQTFLPTEQWNAGFRFITEPSTDMTLAMQFKTISNFQEFLVADFNKRLLKNSKRIEAILKNNPTNVFVWDNKMQFGTGAFRDDIQRYSGHGPAEMSLTLAAIYKTMHGSMMFSAYNQDQLIPVIGKIGGQLGQDSISIFGRQNSELGLTDQERVKITKAAADKKHFLELRDTAENSYGTNLVKSAFVALKNYVYHMDSAYNMLQGKDANPSMGLNPINFSGETNPQIKRAVNNMTAVVKGVAEVRDPVSGKSVTVNLPAFYNTPPKKLSVLFADTFDQTPDEKIIKAKNGDALKVRNYYRGSSIGWNNNNWKAFVPSAEGKEANYMSEARRIMRYSLGTSMVMSLPAIFVH